MEDDNQPTSLYRLPVGGASADILEDIDDRILSPPSGMCSKKVSKLLQYLRVHNRRFYCFEGDETTKACSLNHHVTELVGLRSYDNLSKTDFILSSSEAEDMEVALRFIVETTSWMDWWTYAVKSLALQSSTDTRLVCRLSLAGARCQLLLAKTTSTVWANLVLKRFDSVLAKVNDSISFESFMNLHSARLSYCSELFLPDILERAVERYSKVLHDEAIHKAIA